jgi:hypothetical protein
MVMSRSERRVAVGTALVVVALGLWVVSRFSPASLVKEHAALPCGLEGTLTREQCDRMVNYLVQLGLQSGAIPPVSVAELRAATGMEMPETAMPCLHEYATTALAERRATTVRTMLRSRSPSLV